MSVSVVAASVRFMGGGTEQQPSDQLDDVERRWLTRRARAAADADVLAGAPFLADAVDRLRSAIADLLDVRWTAASPDELRAALRCLAGEQARLDAAVLGPLRALDGQDDGGTRTRSMVAGFLQHGLGLERRRARREVATAALLEPDAG